jgi:hypothetical protein
MQPRDHQAVKSDPKSTTSETAEYIGGIAKELRSLASQADLGFLAYLLSMVEQEATDTRSRGGPRQVEGKDT